MSRHRLVRNIDIHEYNEDLDGYPRSYEDSYSVSPGAAQYLRRDSLSGDLSGDLSGELEAYSKPAVIPTLREYLAMYKIDAKTEEKIRKGIDKVLGVIGSELEEEAEVADALLFYNFDIEKTISWLLDNRSSKPPAAKKTPQKEKEKEAQPPKDKKGEARGIPAFAFDTPSPDDVVTQARTNKSAGEPLFAKTPVIKPAPAMNFGSEQPISQLTAGLSGISLGERSLSSSGDPKAGKKPEEAPKPKNTKLSKAKVNIQEEYAGRKKEKENLNLIVVGHVDAGKSTLMGHLLFLLGEVSQKLMTKHERDSQKIGKSSFAFAWALDETEEERKRGITMDVATRKFETEHRKITLLDAPGHRDFIPKMISGASQADVAILVVDATRGEFEAGFESDGQTKEHSLLIRSLGVHQLIVVVNKLDNEGWSQDRFKEIEGKLLPFLKQTGFREQAVTFVPCSGLKGENLMKRTAEHLSNWYSGPTLVQAIDSLSPPERAVDKPLRISISDTYKGAGTGSTVITGKIESGYVSKDDQLVLMPGNEVVTVKSVEVHENPVKLALAGETATIGLAGVEREHIGNFSLLCESTSVVRVTNTFLAQILVFEVKTPIIKGATVVFHYLSMNEQATITKLIGLMDKSGDITQKNPRFLTKGTTALVEMRISKPICIEVYKDFKELGRFTLRSAGKTIAAGLVQEIP